VLGIVNRMLLRVVNVLKVTSAIRTKNLLRIALVHVHASVGVEVRDGMTVCLSRCRGCAHLKFVEAFWLVGLGSKLLVGVEFLEKIISLMCELS